jgi:hypothetical protein
VDHNVDIKVRITLQRTAKHDYVIMEHQYIKGSIKGRSTLPVVTAIWKCLIEVLTYGT